MEPMVQLGRKVRLKAITFVIIPSIVFAILTILILYREPARLYVKLPAGFEFAYEAKTESKRVDDEGKLPRSR